jgi:muramidase (phage lysozyme)
MSAIQITDQDRALLELIAKGEAVQGSDPYISVYPNTTEPMLIQMTCAEVLRYQQQRVAAGFKSSACGKYQFIRRTLASAIQIAGVDPLGTRFTPDVQDALIISILRRSRGLDQWKAKSLPTDRFMIRLAQEFASIPVPYAMQGHSRQVNKGQSYYAGDGLNKAHHDPDTFYQELVDILNGGPGTAATIPIDSSGPSGALPAEGTSARTQAQRAAGGSGVGNVVGGNAGAQPLPASILPESTTVYVYRATDPLDDRYDFRTGDKVKDLLIHGTNAAAASPITATNIGQSNVAGTNIGVVPPIPPTVNLTPPTPPALDPTAPPTLPNDLDFDLLDQALNGTLAVPPTASTNSPCPSPVTQGVPVGQNTPGAIPGVTQSTASSRSRVIDTPNGTQTIVEATSTTTTNNGTTVTTSETRTSKQFPRFGGTGRINNIESLDF